MGGATTSGPSGRPRAEQKASRKAEKAAEQQAEREARRAAKEAAKAAAEQERQAAQAATMATEADPAAEANGSLTIVHAIPDLAVDVYIDGAVVAPNVAFGTTQTLELAPATILVEVRGAGAPATDPPLLEQTFRIKPNVAKSFVAYLNADGEPEDDVFYDNVIQNQTKAQLTVRHLAAAPAVDVYVNGELTFEGLSNPNQAKAFLDAGTYTVQITAAGDPATVVLPDTPVTLDARTNTIVSASGDLAAGTFSTVTQVLPMDVVGHQPGPRHLSPSTLRRSRDLGRTAGVPAASRHPTRASKLSAESVARVADVRRWRITFGARRALCHPHSTEEGLPDHAQAARVPRGARGRPRPCRHAGQRRRPPTEDRIALGRPRHPRPARRRVRER